MKLHYHATLIEYNDTLYKQITNTLEHAQLDVYDYIYTYGKEGLTRRKSSSNEGWICGVLHKIKIFGSFFF